MFRNIILIISVLIVLVGCSEGHRNTSLSKSDDNTKSTSAFIDQNGYNQRPFSIKANGWKNDNQVDLVLSWRGDGGMGTYATFLKIEPKDYDAIGAYFGYNTTQNPEATVNDMNYDGYIDLADQNKYAAAEGETFNGFYLYWNNGAEVGLFDANGLPNEYKKYNDPSTLADESKDGYKFSSNGPLTVGSTRNSLGFLESSFKPLKSDGNGGYIPLLSDDSYFLLVPFGYSNEAGKTTGIIDQFLKLRVNNYNPTDIKFTLDESTNQIKIDWFDNDNTDVWGVKLKCYQGTWASSGTDTITLKNLTSRTLTEQWIYSTNTTEPVRFEVEVSDSWGLAETLAPTRLIIDPYIRFAARANKLWLSYKCNNYPPKNGDIVFVYGYLMNNYYSMNGNSVVTLWTTQNTLTPAVDTHPNSYFNIGGRGLYTSLDLCQTTPIPPNPIATGEVLTPSNQYLRDRIEYSEGGPDNDIGIFGDNLNWSFNSAPMRSLWINPRPTKYETTASYLSITPQSGRNVNQDAMGDVKSRINNGVSVTAYQSGTQNKTPTYHLPSGQNGYWFNCVFRVIARKGTQVKIGLIPVYLPIDTGFNEATVTSSISTNDKTEATWYGDHQAVLVLPCNDIVFTVGG